MNFVGNTIFRLNCLNSELKNICFFNRADILLLRCRGVAQPGRVLAWGARGRRFESRHPDHKNSNRPCADFNFYQWV